MEPDPMETALAEQLAVTRKARKAAQRDRAHAVVGRMLQTEADLLAEIATLRRLQKPPDETITPQGLRDAVLAMPDMVFEHLVAAVDERHVREGMAPIVPGGKPIATILAERDEHYGPPPPKVQ